MATWVKEIIPPFIYKKLTTKNNKRKLYANYEEALKDCPNEAYEEVELIKVILEKTRIYSSELSSKQGINSDIRTLSLISGILISKSSLGHINILDFGGACGAHYFTARKVIPKTIKLKWVVVETPTMVKYGKALSNDELSFEEDLDIAVNKLNNVDLLFTSGAIQCVDKPLNYLKRLIDINANYLLFNRVGLTLGNYDVTIIHESKLSWNGIGSLPPGFKDRWVKYPFHFIQKSSFDSVLKGKYEKIYEVEDNSGIFPVNEEELEGKDIQYKRID